MPAYRMAHYLWPSFTTPVGGSDRSSCAYLSAVLYGTGLFAGIDASLKSILNEPFR